MSGGFTMMVADSPFIFIFEDSGRQCKTVENSGIQWKRFANSLVTVEEVA